MMLTRNKIVQLIAVAICLFVATAATIQAEEHAGKEAENKSNATAPNLNWGQMSQATQKSMDPSVMNNLMNMMMTSPDKLMSIESCAQCHTDEEVARYQKDFGPMMEAMKPMMGMMNPMMAMMNPMMGPMMGMMNPMMYPMMGMMNPMMGPMMGMATPMMNPMMDMSGAMMSPMMGMVNPMMGPMMNPAGMMDPKQYEQWFNQWTESMKNMAPQPQATK